MKKISQYQVGIKKISYQRNMVYFLKNLVKKLFFKKNYVIKFCGVNGLVREFGEITLVASVRGFRGVLLFYTRTQLCDCLFFFLSYS